MDTESSRIPANYGDPLSAGEETSERGERPSAKESRKLRVYSRRGDLGETSLFSGPRVGKDHKRIEAVGTLDELSSFLGLARSFGLPPEIDTELESIQRKLLEVGTEIVSLTPSKHDVKTVQLGDIQVLESKIDRWDALLSPPGGFVIPGGTSASASLHLARSVCRRAERVVTALVRSDETVSRRLIAWLNRLGDFLFVLARTL